MTNFYMVAKLVDLQSDFGKLKAENQLKSCITCIKVIIYNNTGYKLCLDITLLQ